MQRDFTIPVHTDEYGNVLNHEEANTALGFVMDSLRLFGGSFTIIALRDEVSRGEFEMRGFAFRYDSFAPARRVEAAEPELAEA